MQMFNASDKPKDKEDYSSWVKSVDVLATNGKRLWRVCHLKTFENAEFPPQWTISGRDGYTDFQVIKWCYLPDIEIDI